MGTTALETAPCSAPAANYARLGLAVIGTALTDCTVLVRGRRVDVHLNNQDAALARQFLSEPNPLLQFWCDVAGLSAPAVVRRYWRDIARYDLKRPYLRMLEARKRRRLRAANTAAAAVEA